MSQFSEVREKRKRGRRRENEGEVKKIAAAHIATCVALLCPTEGHLEECLAGSDCDL